MMLFSEWRPLFGGSGVPSFKQCRGELHGSATFPLALGEVALPSADVLVNHLRNILAYNGGEMCWFVPRHPHPSKLTRLSN